MPSQHGLVRWKAIDCNIAAVTRRQYVPFGLTELSRITILQVLQIQPPLRCILQCSIMETDPECKKLVHYLGERTMSSVYANFPMISLIICHHPLQMIRFGGWDEILAAPMYTARMYSADNRNTALR